MGIRQRWNLQTWGTPICYHPPRSSPPGIALLLVQHHPYGVNDWRRECGDSSGDAGQVEFVTLGTNRGHRPPS